MRGKITHFIDDIIIPFPAAIREARSSEYAFDPRELIEQLREYNCDFLGNEQQVNSF